jgi:16S rRNA (uracil1498-N3)-methyltransferase
LARSPPRASTGQPAADMRTPRLYIPQSLRDGASLVASGQPAHHVKNVLRLRPGAGLRIFNGSGKEHEAMLQDIGRSEITLTIAGPITTVAAPSLHIKLAQGIARNDRMDLILQKAVELGVGAIQPLWMQRSQKHLRGERLERRLQHWHGIVISACEQCGRATLPQLMQPQDYVSWADGESGNGLKLMLQPESTHALQDFEQPHDGITLLVGPEGGLTPEERAIAENIGCTGIRLGQRVLRTETAGIAALAGIQVLWGDFR